MHGESSLSIIEKLWRFAQECFGHLKMLVKPPPFGSEPPSSEAALLFVTVTATVTAVAAQIMASSIPAVISWNSGDSFVPINSLRAWSELQAGDRSLPSITRWGTVLAITIIIAAIVMTLTVLFVRYQRFSPDEFGVVMRRSSVLICTMITAIILLEWILFLVAQSRAPSWLYAVFYLLDGLLQVYVVLGVPYRVWRSALNLPRWRAALGVVLSSIAVSMVFILLIFPTTQFLMPDKRIDDVLASKLLASVRMFRNGQYREALVLTRQAETSHHDSMWLDSLILSLSHKALERATAHSKTPAAVAQSDAQWSSDIQGRYSDLVQVTDRFEDKYSDVPGVLLNVARAQLESGQCEKAEIVFQAIYYHRHAILIERIFAGLYLRTMRHEPSDLKSILARFGPSSDITFGRSITASPGIILAELVKRGNAFSGNDMEDLRKYEEELSQQSSAPRCAFVDSKPLPQ